MQSGRDGKPGSPQNDDMSGNPELFPNDYCLREADELLREYPQAYASRQEAYDGCRAAKGVLEELRQQLGRERGTIVTRP